MARGSLKDTIIGDGTKLDAIVHIAHNVNIAKNCSLTAGTVIGGSTIVGDTSWLGLNSTLKHTHHIYYSFNIEESFYCRRKLLLIPKLPVLFQGRIYLDRL